jgi:hypothetical protein
MNQRSEYEESRCNPIKKNYIMNWEHGTYTDPHQLDNQLLKAWVY